MFSRGSLATRYKNYVKHTKILKDKIQAMKAPTLPAGWINKEAIVSSTTMLRLQKTLSVVQEKLNKYHPSNQCRTQVVHAEGLNETKRPFRNRAILGAAFFSSTSDHVTIQGYSTHDLSILKQLGIVEGGQASNTPIESTNITSVSKATSESEFANDSTLAEHVNNDFPLPLYDVQSESPYQSIFDNMPPENARNDIYTTIYNTFNRQTEVVDDEHLVQEIVTTTDLDSVLESMSQTNNVILLDGHAGEAVSSQLPTESAGVVLNSFMNAIETTNASDVASNICEDINIISNANIDSPITEPIVEAIPEPPAVPDLVAEAASQVNALGEATFASLGLGGWTPVGIVQNSFEYLHVTLGIPWWEAIAIGTLVIRFFMFPLVIIAQRNAAKMNNHLPQMQVLQLKMTEARQSGNQLEASRYSQELMVFMKEKNLNPLKNMIVPLAQMPIFISFFVGLRQMSNVPVDSLRTGGMFWFTDLTVPDQFFALPIITSLTLWATIELGTDSAKLSSQNLQTMKYVLRALPFVILPFTVNFPGAILCYWVSSNFISLAQVGFLKIPSVRDYFKIDPLITHDPQKMPVKNKGFVGGIKDSWTNIKLTKELEERRRLDDLQFQRAGKGPLVKTYKYDPTKQVAKDTPTISAKNR